MRHGHDFHSCKFAHPALNPIPAPVKIYKKRENPLDKDPVSYKESPIEKDPIEIDPTQAKENHSTTGHQTSNLSGDKASLADSTSISHQVPVTNASPDKTSCPHKVIDTSKATSSMLEVAQAVMSPLKRIISTFECPTLPKHT